MVFFLVSEVKLLFLLCCFDETVNTSDLGVSCFSPRVMSLNDAIEAVNTMASTM